MVKMTGVPSQLLADGVTEIVAVTAVVPALTAVNDAMFPVPLAASPIPGVLFVQLNIVPDTAPVKLIAEVEAPLHTIWLPGFVTEAVGLTIIVKIIGVPVQPLADGVTVNVAITGAEPVLIAVNEVISPVPVAESPIPGVLLVQLNIVPPTAPVKLIAVVTAPLHTV